MKKLAITLLLTAHVAFAINGTYSFGLGPGNNMTNSNYATTFGSYAGGDAVANTRTCLFGTVAGMDSRYVQKSVGLGYGALYMASNCVSCVAIGDTVGSRWRNANGWVQIGNGFVYTNGLLNIGNGMITGSSQGVQVSKMADDLDLNGHSIINGRGFSFTMPHDTPTEGIESKVISFDDAYGLNLHDCDINVFSGGVNAYRVSANTIEANNTVKIKAELEAGVNNAFLKFEDHDGIERVTLGLGHSQDFSDWYLCVYTNGYYAGRLAVVP